MADIKELSTIVSKCGLEVKEARASNDAGAIEAAQAKFNEAKKALKAAQKAEKAKNKKAKQGAKKTGKKKVSGLGLGVKKSEDFSVVHSGHYEGRDDRILS